MAGIRLESVIGKPSTSKRMWVGIGGTAGDIPSPKLSMFIGGFIKPAINGGLKNNGCGCIGKFIMIGRLVVRCIPGNDKPGTRSGLFGFLLLS